MIHVEGQKTPLMIRKSDGGYGYGTTDMATLYNRIHVSTWQAFCCQECHTFVCLPNRMQRSPHGDRGAQEMRARMLHADGCQTMTSCVRMLGTGREGGVADLCDG